MGFLARVSRWLKSMDLRFKNKVEEEAFHLAQEAYTVAFCQIGSVCIFISLLVVLSTRSEVLKTNDVPEEFLPPRRMFFFALAASVFLEFIVFSFSVIYRCYRPVLRGWWEAMLVVSVVICVVVTFWCLTPWFVAQIYGINPEELWVKETRQSDLLTVMGCMATVSATCFYGSVRSHWLILVPIGSILAYTVLLLCFEAPFPAGQVQSMLYLDILCVFSFNGAWRHESHLRKEWSASRKVIEQEAQVEEITLINKAFAAMAGTTSDLVLVLDSSLRIIANEDMRAHEAYFGRPLGNLLFPELLAEDITARFLQLLEEASISGLLQSMPAAIELRWGIASAQLVLIHTQSQSNARYLVGIHFNDPTPIQEAELRESVPVLEGQLPLPPVPETAPSQEDDDASSYKENHRLESVVSTTRTGQVFVDIDNIPEEKNQIQPGGTTLKTALKKIARLGMIEHWLVASSEVEILPEKVLGRGGFSEVVLGRVRGSPVAAKVPHRSDTVNMTMLTSLVNEIRVLRHLRHSNIALFYGACIDPASGHLTLLYEVVNGAKATVYVRTTLLEMEGAWQRLCQAKLLLDVASALRYLHSLSPAIVHGDIKGDNVMVEMRKECPHGKLLDFGMSRIRTRHPRLLGGTRCWIAPELTGPVEARPKPAPSSDVYSFGWMIYFVSTFTPPAAAVDMQAMANPNWAVLPLLWPTFDGGEARSLAEPLVTECLRHDYTQRPSMAQLVESLLTWLPENEGMLSSLGPSVVTMLLQGWQRWDEGLVKLSTNAPPPAQRLLPASRAEGTATSHLEASYKVGPPSKSSAEQAPSEAAQRDEEDEDDGYAGHTEEGVPHLKSTPLTLTGGSSSKAIAPRAFMITSL